MYFLILDLFALYLKQYNDDFFYGLKLLKVRTKYIIDIILEWSFIWSACKITLLFIFEQTFLAKNKNCGLYDKRRKLFYFIFFYPWDKILSIIYNRHFLFNYWNKEHKFFFKEAEIFALKHFTKTNRYNSPTKHPSWQVVFVKTFYPFTGNDVKR